MSAVLTLKSTLALVACLGAPAAYLFWMYRYEKEHGRDGDGFFIGDVVGLMSDCAGLDGDGDGDGGGDGGGD